MAICMEDCVFMKEIKTNVMRILDKEKVEYTHHEYPHGKDAVDGVTVATLMNQNPDYVFKTLVTKGMGRDYYVFVVPVDHELDLKKCAKSVGEKSVEMIPGLCAWRLFTSRNEKAVQDNLPHYSRVNSENHCQRRKNRISN
jgi:hypothetical protein